MKDFHDLVAFAAAEGFTVTSTTGGTHNTNSKHYRGLAIDVRTRDKTDSQIAAFVTKAKNKGITIRDERQRPTNQKVWSGAHLHLEL
jgi:hypothetical protein